MGIDYKIDVSLAGRYPKEIFTEAEANDFDREYPHYFDDVPIHVFFNLDSLGIYPGRNNKGKITCSNGTTIHIEHQTAKTPIKKYDLIATRKGLKLIKHEESHVTYN